MLLSHADWSVTNTSTFPVTELNGENIVGANISAANMNHGDVGNNSTVFMIENEVATVGALANQDDIETIVNLSAMSDGENFILRTKTNEFRIRVLKNVFIFFRCCIRY